MSRSVFFAVFVCLLCGIGIREFHVHAQSESCYLHPAALPIPSYAHQAVYVEQKHSVYLFTGAPGVANASVYKWDLSATNSSFQQIGTAPTATFYSYVNNAVLIDHLIYCIGMADMTDKPWTTQTIHVFNTQNETWSSQGSIPWARAVGCLTTNNTHIFLVDGVDDTFNSTQNRNATLMVYNIANSAWSSITLGVVVERGWFGQYCTVLGTSLYVWRGVVDFYYSADGSSFAGYSEGLKVDLDTMQSFKLTLNHNATLRTFGMAVSYQGLSYEVGGLPLSTSITTWDLETGSFESSPNTMTLPTAVWSPAVVIVDQQLYVFGGGTANDPFLMGTQRTDIIQVCDLPTVPYSPTPQSPSSPPSRPPSILPTISPSQTSLTIPPATRLPTTSTATNAPSHRETEDEDVDGNENQDEQEANTTENASNTGMVIGIVAAIAGALIICTAVLCVLHRKKANNETAEGTQSKTSVAEMSPRDEAHNDEIRNWLENVVKLPQYYAVFMEQGVEDMPTVRALTVENLKEMGIDKVGHRVKIIEHAKGIGAGEADIVHPVQVAVEGTEEGAAAGMVDDTNANREENMEDVEESGSGGMYQPVTVTPDALTTAGQ